MTPGGGLNNLIWGPLIQNANEAFMNWRNPIVSGFNSSQGNIYAGASFVGEVVPNLVPVAGMESAASSLLGRAQTWAAKNAPWLVSSVGDALKAGVSWLNKTAPGLNPANYSLNTGRLFSGVPLPEYVGPRGSLHPSAGPYPDPAPPRYLGPAQPDTLVQDHLVNRARGGTDAADNLDSKPWEANARKGGFEGQLQKEMNFYRSQNVPEALIQQIFRDEMKWLRNDVHPRPVDPRLLDKLPAPQHGQ